MEPGMEIEERLEEWLADAGHAPRGEFCEKCWNDAELVARSSGRPKGDAYDEVVLEVDAQALEAVMSNP